MKSQWWLLFARRYNDLLKKRNICIIRSHSGPEHFPTASYPNGFQGRLELIEVHGRSLILISDCTRPNNHFPTDKLSFCHGCSREPESLTSRPVGFCLPHKIWSASELHDLENWSHRFNFLYQITNQSILLLTIHFSRSIDLPCQLSFAKLMKTLLYF